LPVIVIAKSKIKLVFIFFLQTYRKKKTSLADEQVQRGKARKKTSFYFGDESPTSQNLRKKKFLTALASKEN